MRIRLIILLLIISTAAWAEEKQITVPTQQEPVSVEAHVVEATPPVKQESGEITPGIIHASGEVLFIEGKRRLYADDFLYRFGGLSGNTGLLSNATFTTCDLPHPDYRICAKEIELTPNQRLKAHRVRIYLGNTRIISLPGLSMNIGPGGGGQTALPHPGFSSRDGLFLSFGYPILNSSQRDLSLLLKLTTNQGVQGGIISGYALKGDLKLAPPFVPDFDSELRRQTILQPAITGKECYFSALQAQPNVLSLFAALLSRQRAYDTDEPDLLASRLPEVGIRYVSPQFCAGGDNGLPSLGAQSEARASWGSFKEVPGTGYNERWDIRGTTSTILRSFGRTTAMRAAGLARLSVYGNGDSYRVLGGALDVSHVFTKGSFISLRLILHSISGETPFEFDDIDIPRDLQAAGRYVRGRNTYGGLIDYDLHDHSIQNWEFSFSRRLHCLEPTITWQGRFSQVSLDLRVLGL